MWGSSETTCIGCVPGRVQSAVTVVVCFGGSEKFWYIQMNAPSSWTSVLSSIVNHSYDGSTVRGTSLVLRKCMRATIS
ncbi:MAG: hypothetical protein NT062_34810 [Proteobacteria bacterium]|nr:hypothetical protein [Pseudomonadota bacterium]